MTYAETYTKHTGCVRNSDAKVGEIEEAVVATAAPVWIHVNDAPRLPWLLRNEVVMRATVDIFHEGHRGLSPHDQSVSATHEGAFSSLRFVERFTAPDRRRLM
jgi:hypothetical protein